ncbi:serine/threonine-protein kinase [Phaeodactylibacter xiamenensis]|uniref:serine/threonine-protein kinase n=1 Tax=Phaeodactylibacter xiamenensis TaxID=1524460 RepID=UPI0024A99786|nr:serine/threonine-protein kinase [Phaeodactylibacter xiamenensis]
MEMTYSSFESRYRDKKYIGSGGFAKVYKVFDHANNHYVALKVADVRPEWKQFTLQREVELVNKLEWHRNIARYDACYRFNTGIAGEMDFAVLKFYEQGNLDQFIKRQKDLTPEDVRIIVRGIIDGIDFLHRHDIIHRDMKCQNILMHREDGVWTPKITDFGLSRQLGGNHTITNSAVGLSFAYAAPEQIKNQKIYKNVDLWAVGVIIYRIVAGELPFETNNEGDQHSSQSQLELSQKIIKLKLPEKLEHLQEPYRTLVKRCLVSEPKERAQSPQELIDILNTGEAMVEEAGRQRIDEPLSSSSFRHTGPHAPFEEQGQKQHGAQIETEDLSYPGGEYQVPDENPTQILTPHPTEEPLPPKSDFSSGAPKQSSKSPWLIALLVLLLMAVAYWRWDNELSGSNSTTAPEVGIEQEQDVMGSGPAYVSPEQSDENYQPQNE